MCTLLLLMELTTRDLCRIVTESHISFTSDSLLAGLDYDGQSQVVTMSASLGPSEVCFNITIIDDADVEIDEEFLISFEIISGTSTQPGAINSTCISITDDDDSKEHAVCLQ